MSKRNWDRLQSQKPSDSMKYRDVYEDQQLERSKIEEKQSPLSRIVLITVLAVFVFALVYVVISVGQYMGSSFRDMGSNVTSQLESGGSSLSSNPDEEPLPYGSYRINGIIYHECFTENGIKYEDEDGNIYDKLPEEKTTAGSEENQTTSHSSVANATGVVMSSFSACLKPSLVKIAISFAVALIFWGIMYQVMMRNLKAQNMLSDTSDINQYQNDQHVALPEEVQRKFDWFPDVGAHSNVQVSSMISHMALMNKGINPIQIAERAKEDILDEDGDVEYYKGEVLLDDDENPITKKAPMIDEKFMDDLFTASGAPDDKTFRKYYDTTKIPYNPGGKDRTKQGGKWDTVAELINHDWVFPIYEPQRPAGAYLVDTEPVNTMV